MAGRCEACRAVDIKADVVITPGSPLAGVQSHPNTNVLPLWPRFVGQGALSLSGGGHRVRGRTEDREERVALGSDLYAVMGRQGSANKRIVALEHRAILRTQSLEQPRRAFDVGEQEGDRAGRKVVAHDCMMARSQPVIQSPGRSLVVRDRVIAGECSHRPRILKVTLDGGRRRH